ncbi:MAG: cbb3-type cytochrome c oxidase subunit 3 [Gammaproteobacteria bacterium]|nr:cbb3-type cytochrome c oxidase subunit 3 [Gammaproteobacteria bacterium]
MCLIAFVGIVWWAYSPARRKRFDDAAQIPFEDDNDAGQPGNDEENKQ